MAARFRPDPLLFLGYALRLRLGAPRSNAGTDLALDGGPQEVRAALALPQKRVHALQRAFGQARRRLLEIGSRPAPASHIRLGIGYHLKRQCGYFLISHIDRFVDIVYSLLQDGWSRSMIFCLEFEFARENIFDHFALALLPR
ncbi:hypothetical protein V5F40_22910 [Xanthobacter sp. DSM 14520]|uniref:hypothetical protein n=1 Tax=Xanthobacter autotrophicus (strain ATCC BAA-1158 / Py2) TaxID=78245 RepID=UPI00372B991F